MSRKPITASLPTASGRTVGMGIALIAVAALTAACGGGSSNTAAAAPSTTPSAGASGQAAPGQGTARPGTTGKISQVNATSVYVVADAAGGSTGGGQVTVNFSASTTFTKTGTVGASALKVGDCVTASSRSATASAAPSPAASTGSTTVAATTVTITATSGSCTTAGFGGGGGGARRSAAPRPSTSAGAQGGFGGNGGGGFNAAFGSVTAVNGSGFTVSETRRASGASSASASAAPTLVTVTTSPTTTYEQTSASTKAALVVGQCATAIGAMDDTGAVTARSISVRPPTNGTCSNGFGGAGGRFRSGTATASAGA